MDAMKGKSPISVIKDGDLAMKNAIKTVFPESHHRLCAWHLLRNAISNVGNPEFMPYLKRCMLGDHDVVQFEQMWEDMVDKFGLQDNNWIREMYEKRKWAVAHLRGNFFAGIRTTSRCEALHSHVAKFVHPKICLTEFVEQYQRCLTYFRFREVEVDFESEYGDVVLQTSLQSIEKSASQLFTKEIFLMFRQIIVKGSLMRVVDTQETAMYTIYSVEKYRGCGTIWQVSHCPELEEFRCSCMRMESIGLLCSHILGVLVALDAIDLPKCLVLERWSKTAKKSFRTQGTGCLLYWDSHLVARHASMLFLLRDVAVLAYLDDVDYNRIIDNMTHERNMLRLKYSNADFAQNNQNGEPVTVPETLHDPAYVRTKGCGPSNNGASGRGKRDHRCGLCSEIGHNRRSCPAGRQNGKGVSVTLDQSQTVLESGIQDEEETDT